MLSASSSTPVGLECFLRCIDLPAIPFTWFHRTCEIVRPTRYCQAKRATAKRPKDRKKRRGWRLTCEAANCSPGAMMSTGCTSCFNWSSTAYGNRRSKHAKPAAQGGHPGDCGVAGGDARRREFSNLTAAGSGRERQLLPAEPRPRNRPTRKRKPRRWVCGCVSRGGERIPRR
jgi:hypothetical protein